MIVGITSFQGGVSKNHNEVYPYLGYNGNHPKTRKITNASKDMGVRVSEYTVAGNVNENNHYRT